MDLHNKSVRCSTGADTLHVAYDKLVIAVGAIANAADDATMGGTTASLGGGSAWLAGLRSEPRGSGGPRGRNPGAPGAPRQKPRGSVFFFMLTPPS